MANSLNIDLTNKYVILKKKYYKGDILDRMFKCEDGFGLSPSTMGKAVLGHFTVDGEKVRVEGYDIERIATEKEISQAKFK